MKFTGDFIKEMICDISQMAEVGISYDNARKEFEDELDELLVGEPYTREEAIEKFDELLPKYKELFKS